MLCTSQHKIRTHAHELDQLASLVLNVLLLLLQHIIERLAQLLHVHLEEACPRRFHPQYFVTRTGVT